MRAIQAIATAVLTCAVLGITACGSTSNSNNNPATPNSPAGNGPSNPSNPSSTKAWSQVYEKTVCEAMDPRACVGMDGFWVRSDGSYTAGAPAGGTPRTGNVTAAELQQLDTLAGPVISTRQTKECDDVISIPGTQDRVQLMLNDSTTFDAYRRPPENAVNGVCYQGNKADVDKLHDYFYSLMQKYYPNPATSAGP